MTYAGAFKLVFCLVVSVILCFMNYSLYYQYESATYVYSTAPPSRVGLRLQNSATTRLFLSDYHDGNESLPTEAVLEANILTHKDDFQRPTDKLLVSPESANPGTDTGQEVIIHPPTSRQLSPSTTHKEAIRRNVTQLKLESSHNAQKQTIEQYNAPSDQREIEKKSKDLKEQANLQPIHTEKTGFVVALKIYEQQTMASGNLMQLQCWAKLLNLAVVKPFMKDSFLSTPMDETKHYTMLTLDDTFDMDDWSQHTAKLGYAPLVDWHHFVQNAPRDVIVVQIKYPTLTHVKAVRSQGLAFPHPPSGEEYKEGCRFKMLSSSGKLGTALRAKSFRVVRKVCFNFLTGDELSLKQFHSDILGEYQPENVTIIFDEWRGIKENQRVLLQEDFCQEEHPYREFLKPSQRLLKDAEAYAKRFLTQDNTTIVSNTSQASNSPEYLAIIARYEMTGLTRSLKRGNDSHAIIPYCLQLTLETMEWMQWKSGLRSTFLSIDIGKYGSHSFGLKNYFNHLADMESFVRQVYCGKMDVREWERTFEAVAHTTDGGYIAMLQEVLVVRAKCIIFVGGGSFQRHAFNLYSELHPDKDERCYRVIEKCTTPYRPIQK